MGDKFLDPSQIVNPLIMEWGGHRRSLYMIRSAFWSCPKVFCGAGDFIPQKASWRMCASMCFRTPQDRTGRHFWSCAEILVELLCAGSEQCIVQMHAWGSLEPFNTMQVLNSHLVGLQGSWYATRTDPSYKHESVVNSKTVIKPANCKANGFL